MAVREYQCLDELQTITRVSWRIKVTIIRRWNDYPTDRPRDRRFNMIFLDEKVTLNITYMVTIPGFFTIIFIIKNVEFKYSSLQNNSMHVWIPFALVHRFADQLFEGGLYEIQDFYVRSFNGKYKCLNQNKHIIMSHATNIRALYVPNFYDPVPFFEFTDLANLTEDNFQDSHCIGNIYYHSEFYSFGKSILQHFYKSYCFFTDVVGIIRLRKRIKYITNRNNQQYTYLDFAISDAR